MDIVELTPILYSNFINTHFGLVDEQHFIYIYTIH